MTHRFHRGAPSMLTCEVQAHPARFSGVHPLQLRRTPLLYAAFACAVGVYLSQCWRPAALLVFGTASLLAVAAVALCWAARLVPAVVLLVWLLLGWTLGVLHPRALPDHALLSYADGLRRDAVGTVTELRPLPLPVVSLDEDPQRPSEQASDREDEYASRSYEADLHLEQIEQLDPNVSRMERVDATARVVLSALDAAHVRCGSPIVATVRLYRPREFRDPGVWRYSDWLAEHDVSASGMVIPNHLHVASVPKAPWNCRLQQTRAWAADRLRNFAEWQREAHVPTVMRWDPEDTAAWSAMLFGDRTELTHRLRTSFEQTGTFHLFVVSGLHIGVIAAVLLWLANRIRLPRWLGTLMTAVVTATYALLTGFGPPVQRALLMTLVYLLAQNLSRERNAMNAVGAAVIAMLLLRPQVLWDSSFQMTVLIALTIAGIAVPLLDRTVGPYARACGHLDLKRFDRRLPPHVAQFRVMLRWITAELENVCGRWAGWILRFAVRSSLILLSATVLAVVTELTMSLPMALYFHRFTALALPANLLVVPLLLPMMVGGIVAFLLCLLAYPLALAASVPAALLLHGTTFVVHSLAGLQAADLRTPGPATAVALLLAACVGISVVLLRSPRRTMAWLGVICAVSVLVGSVALPKRAAPVQALQIDAIDVGQGDSILLTAPNGAAMLVDAGGVVGAEDDPRQAARQNAFDIGEEVVSPYLWQRGIVRLDLLVLTHAHMDHLGGMAAVLRNFRPRELWVSIDVPSARLHALLDQARTQGTAVRRLRAGAHLDWRDIGMDVLGPGVDYQAGSTSVNDDSLVLRASYGRASALLAGDAELASEQVMLASHGLTTVTLLKVGHHGSQTSSSEAFLSAIQPRVAVISCGRGNYFGHPRMPVLMRMQAHHIATSRTDTMGAVEYTLFADGRVRTEIPRVSP